MSALKYLVLLPLIAILAFVEVFPLLVSFYLSITNYNQGGIFVGAANYLRILSDSQFATSLLNSILYSVGSTGLALLVALGLAFVVSELKRGKGPIESLFLAPVAVAPIVVGVIWSPSAVWDDVNTFVHFVLGLPYIDLTNPLLAFPIMIVSEAWEWSPILMLVALSVMSSVPKEVYEAASVHGASRWKVFRAISIPAILRSPVTQFLIVLRFIDAMRAFEIPFSWAAWTSQPNISSPISTLSLYLYNLLTVPTNGFPLSYVSAAAMVLFVVTLAAASTLFVLMKRVGKL